MTKLVQLLRRIFAADTKPVMAVRLVALVFAIGIIASLVALPGPGSSPEPENGRGARIVEADSAEGERLTQDAQSPESEMARQRAERARGLDFTYTDLRDVIKRRQVAFAAIAPAAFEVTVELQDGSTHTTNYPPSEDKRLAEDLAAAGASVSVEAYNRGGSSSGIGTVLFALLLIGTLVAVAILLQRRSAGGTGGGVAKDARLGNKKVEDDQAPAVRFSDVAGCDEAVEEVRETVDFLLHPTRYEKLGAKPPRGVLLYGPPGTGKTLLAKAVAGESGAAFFAASGSDFVQMYVGVGASRVRELFRSARLQQPAVIFIDEIDAIGKKRSSGGVTGGNDERDQTLNQLLVELDGFENNARIIVIAATNRLDTLDPALLRPGRLSRHVHVGAPSEEGRRAILAVHAKSKPLHEDVNLDALAASTAGASGAELAEMLNEGAMMAARHNSSHITHDHLWEGFLRVVAGPRKASGMLAAGEREAVAYHEAGHVLCAELCPTVDKTLHATINPRGQAAGFAVVGQTDRSLQNEQDIHEQLIYILGGRAAEYVLYQTVSSGAANDLQKANAIARRAVEEFGLSEKVGQAISGESGFSEEMRAVADSEVRRLVEHAYADAIALVTEHRAELEALAGALLAAGDIDRPEIVAAMNGAIATPKQPKMHVPPALSAAPVDLPPPPPPPSRRRRRALSGAGLKRKAVVAFGSVRDRRRSRSLAAARGGRRPSA